MIVKITMTEFLEWQDEYNGICLECGAIRFGDTEPDAEEYHCDNCGKDKVQGMENAMIEGNILVEGE